MLLKHWYNTLCLPLYLHVYGVITLILKTSIRQRNRISFPLVETWSFLKRWLMFSLENIALVIAWYFLEFCLCFRCDDYQILKFGWKLERKSQIHKCSQNQRYFRSRKYHEFLLDYCLVVANCQMRQYQGIYQK